MSGIVVGQRGLRPRMGGWGDVVRGVLVNDAFTRSVLAFAIVVGAYHYSLLTLVRALAVDSPLAYLGLIPAISAAMIVYTAAPTRSELEVHDRTLDRILGLPFMVIPLAVMFTLPEQLSTYFWVWRIDLLTLPVFVAGTIVFLFGTRTLIRTRLGVLWLFAAWPVPFQFIVQRGLEPFTNLTVDALETLVAMVPLARRLNHLEGGFIIEGPSEAFTVVVASACSGANSLVGFVLLGGALAALGTGARLRKALWIATGAALVWTLNVVRIALIFLAGTAWGERAAIDIFHPYIGLVFFSVAVTAMVLSAPRFGLTLGGRRREQTSLTASLERSVPSFRTAGAALLVLALVMGVVNDRLSEVDPVAGALGTPKIAEFEQTALTLEGFSGERIDRFDWTERFFGEGSDWSRFRFSGDGTAALSSDATVLADVVTTSNVQAFNDFGVEACYRFHGYGVANEQRIDLGSGVKGNVLVWRDPDRPVTWTSVYWHWPIATSEGRRYQRVVLMYNTSTPSEIVVADPSTTLAGQLGIDLDAYLDDEPTRGGSLDQLDGSTLRRDDAHAERVQVFLVQFAKHLISTSASTSVGLVDAEGALK